MTRPSPDRPAPEGGPPPERSWVMGRSARWHPPPGGGAGLHDQRDDAFPAREALEWASTADPRTLHGCLTLCELLIDLVRKYRRSRAEVPALSCGSTGALVRKCRRSSR